MHRHRFAIIAALLIAGCASSGGNHDLGVTIFETVTASPFGGIQAVTLVGSHMLRVQIENHSHQEIMVHTVRLEPNDPDLWTDDPPESVEELIGPGDKRSFDMMFTVSTSSRARSTTSQALESVKVDLSCTAADTGNFIAGGTYSVNHVALGQ